VCLFGLLMRASANSAIQEASGAAITAARLVAVYALARALSSIANEVEGMLLQQK
jgi:hypothetical protein